MILCDVVALAKGLEIFAKYRSGVEVRAETGVVLVTNGKYELTRAEANTLEKLGWGFSDALDCWVALV